MPATPLLMDVDTGVDDALALLLALSSPEVELIGVSTVAGNVPLHQTTDNTLRLLQWAGRADVPVYAGAERPLVRDAVAADDVHGATGLGAAQLPEARTSSAGDGVEFLLSTLQARPGEVTLVATGPLTNLARAEARAPGVLRQARQVVIMGGAVRVPGNITPTAEFNFYADPHAAHQVLASAAELVLVGLDVTEQVWLAQTTLQACTGTHAAFCRAACEPVIAFESAHYGFAGMHVHDPVALGAALWPQLFHTQQLWVDVETTGELTAGQVVVDQRALASDQERLGRPVACAVEVDQVRFLELFTERVLQN
ncbi:MAG: nucleoside hydrolase [Gemmatimonadetes bacterium]|nr:nucleoside hydrolase [Gemmatimonadota bacterium]MXY83511.1 nucleoside hydrolase [Gemmatimonadota bacterium]MYB67341.1 nucleoside hydrolase [Gemmatimonadota bacterium]